MNYRHAYHAGNHTDVFKHAVLVMLLEYLRRKDSAFVVLDTHAGAGRYDLRSRRGGKDRRGGRRHRPRASARPFPRGGLSRPRSAASIPTGFAVYPGSPAIVAAFLRDTTV